MAATLLQRPDNAQLYNTTASSWPRGPKVQIRIGDYPQPLSLPLAFLEGSGNTTYRFIEELCQKLVNEPGQLSWNDSEHRLVNLSDSPQAGQGLAFTPIQSDTLFTWAHGPDGRYKGRPHPPADPFDDSASISASQVSSLQNGLREMIVFRDGWCIVSGTTFERSQAAHLAPKHRNDVYEKTLGDDFEPPPYRASYAVMLETNLHKAYDRFRWSFYTKGHNLVVHVFNGSDPGLRVFHGTVVTPDRFRLAPDLDIEAPDKRLIEWHYKQCVRLNVRGFWAP